MRVVDKPGPKPKPTSSSILHPLHYLVREANSYHVPLCFSTTHSQYVYSVTTCLSPLPVVCYRGTCCTLTELLPVWRWRTRRWAEQHWTVSWRTCRWACVRGLCASNRQELAPSVCLNRIKNSINTLWWTLTAWRDKNVQYVKRLQASWSHISKFKTQWSNFNERSLLNDKPT